MSVALIPLTIAPFAAGSLNPITDAALGAVLIIHSHIGFDACVKDYVPRRKYGAFAGFTNFLLYASTAIVFGMIIIYMALCANQTVGVYEFQTNDVGLTEAIKR